MRYLVAILLLLGGVFYFIDNMLGPSFQAVAIQLVSIRAGESINQAVLRGPVTKLSYSDLYLIHRNDKGMVTFLQPNTSTINRAAAEVTLSVQNELKKLSKEKFQVPLAQAFGNRVWGGLGPTIPFRIESIGNVRTTLDSRFEQAGMNQTRHIVEMVISANVQIVTPTVITVLPVKERIPIAEGIIVGPVPTGGILYQTN